MAAVVTGIVTCPLRELAPRARQVDLPLLKHKQQDVHGLLGQRALAPASLGQGGAHGGVQLESEALSRVSFGHQGEGAIAGHYADYMVSSLADHSGFRFCQFGTCGAPQ